MKIEVNGGGKGDWRTGLETWEWKRRKKGEEIN